MSKSIMSDICREFGETSLGSGSGSETASPPSNSQAHVTNKKIYKKPYKKPQPKPSMYIVIDERETKLYDAIIDLVRLGTFSVSPEQVVKRVLVLGDICIRNEDDQDVCIIERKSAQDLIASIKDSRYEEQSHRLIHASNVKPHNIVYIIENTLDGNCKPCEKKMFYSAIVSLSMFKGFSVMKTANIYETAELVMAFLEKIQKNFNKQNYMAHANPNTTPALDETATTTENYSTFVKKVKHENISKTNFAEIVLTQIPGLSSVTACAVMKQFRHLGDLIDTLKTNKDCLDNIKTDPNGKPRKLGKNVISSIQEFLIFSQPPAPSPINEGEVADK